MFKNLCFTILLIFAFGKAVKAQPLQTQVESINKYIEQNSDSNENYYAKINATQRNIYFYNGYMHSLALTFAVDKIDADNIKITKKGLKFLPNEQGDFVIRKFANSEKIINTAWLGINNMSKENKVELKNMMRKFILDYQNVIKK